ncbi:MAG TPA: hypothetical protein VHT24_08415 [Pseudacidobacterium sp.]|jgi:Flp pilus assembly secretin CpaC|nr:hypothetical protein [Pseudacidobacterium sp.]
MMVRGHIRGVLCAVLTLATAAAYAQAPSTQAPPPPPKPVSQHEQAEASKAFLEGAKAIKKDDLREAVKNFQRAAQLDPENRNYSTALLIAKEHLLTELVQGASKARLLGHDDQARTMLSEAYTLDPQNPIVGQHIDELARDNEPHSAILMPAVEEAGPPVQLIPKPGKQSFHLHTSGTEVLRQVLTAFGITPTLDSSVKGQLVRFDVDDVNFAQAAEMLNLATGTFFVPLDAGRVLIAADTKENRTKFERQIMETVYVPGLTNEEMTSLGNMIHNVFEIQQAVVQAQNNTLTIRGPRERVDALNHTLTEMLDGRSQVLLHLRLYSIDETRMTNIGVQLPQQTTIFNVPSEVNQIIENNQSAVQQIIAAGLANAGDNIAIVAVLIATGVVSGTVFNQPFALFGGGLTESGLTLNQGATLNLSLNSSATRLIDQVQLRVQDQDDGKFIVGSRYPIITSTYSNVAGNTLSIPGISQSGLSSILQNLGVSSSALTSSLSATIPQVQYQDLGLMLSATPHIQQNHDVSLKLDFKITSLSGQTANGNPILNNQEYQAYVTLPQGESALVVSNVTKSQTAAITGVPGLSDLPGFQSTTNKEAEVDTSKLVILITPYIMRLSHTRPTGQIVMLPTH